MGAHFFHPVLNTLITIATMDFDSSLKMSVGIMLLFWKLIDVTVARFQTSSGREHMQLKFDPAIFVFDAQGSNWISVRTHFGGNPEVSLEAREQGCMFHFLQGINRLVVIIRSESTEHLAQQFKKLAEDMIHATDLELTVDMFKRFNNYIMTRKFIAYSL